MFFSRVVSLIFLGQGVVGLPTLYDYYTGEGVTSGLSVDQPYFTLNGQNITILSGTIHYFRVPPQYWRDRIRKLRAAGLNTLETYVAWNLHEPQNGIFDFGDGGTDMGEFLDLVTYLQIAQEEDLFVIIRPGPFICAEWEWGGFPGWLLSEEDYQVRTADPKFMEYVDRYFTKLLGLLAPLQFTKGGPIIAMQVENEYGAAVYKDINYIQQLHDIMRREGIVELLLTSDGALSGQMGTIPDLLFQTVNFGGNPDANLALLEVMQPGRPLMVMEFWSGWFDHWTEIHNTISTETFSNDLEAILLFPASVNFYMFHGGTSWGFLNGANNILGDNGGFQPITNSYDYDAPVSEAGDYNEKYFVIHDVLEKYQEVEFWKPEIPELMEKIQYGNVEVTEVLKLNDLLKQLEGVPIQGKALPMEKLGQSFGYIIYEKELNLNEGAVLQIGGHLRDTLLVLLNEELISGVLNSSQDLNNFGFWRMYNSQLEITNKAEENAKLQLVFENWGRANFGNLYRQFKGLTDENPVSIDAEELQDWVAYSLEFRKSWIENLQNWNVVGINEEIVGPALYKAILTVDEVPKDTFIDTRNWVKGLVIVNGFVLGKYAMIGPQQTLYLPGVFLQTGENEILIFEHFQSASEIRFSSEAIYETH